MTHRCQRILVVNRSAASQFSFSDALRREGIGLMLVSGSDAAFQAMEGGFIPDAILIDLAVKDSSAADFLRRVKATYAVPVIAISPGAIQCRIGPTADKELREFFDVRELLTVLDELCTFSPKPCGPR